MSYAVAYADELDDLEHDPDHGVIDVPGTLRGSTVRYLEEDES